MNNIIDRYYYGKEQMNTELFWDGTIRDKDNWLHYNTRVVLGILTQKQVGSSLDRFFQSKTNFLHVKEPT